MRRPQSPLETNCVVWDRPALAADLRDKLMQYVARSREYVQGTWTRVLDDPFETMIR